MISEFFFQSNQGHSKWRLTYVFIIVTIAVLLSSGQPVQAQTFNSGSDESDGALDFSGTPSGTIIDFDPTTFSPPLDPDGDNVYHFTTISIPTGVTVRLSAQFLNGPVFWLASGVVQIDGIIDLNGEDGQNGQDITNNARFFAVPGAGGFGGGLGGMGSLTPTAGNGPGGGPAIGIGAGHVNGNPGFGILPYGNDFLVPLIGGSGGGGGIFLNNANGGSGGAGGGALLIASSISITVNGTIQANGGTGGESGDKEGGSGSGGSIHLLAPSIGVTGTLHAKGGPLVTGGSSRTVGSIGRIRVEAFQRTFTGSTTDPAPIFTAPFGLFLPTNPPSSVRVVSVAGISVPSSPTGSFTAPDIAINDASPVTVDIEAQNIPLGTIVKLHLLFETVGTQIIDSTPLAGTLALSTATATVTIPSGFSLGFVRATWTTP